MFRRIAHATGKKNRNGTTLVTITNDEGESEYDDSADMVDYEYRTPDWYGQEEIIFPKYRSKVHVSLRFSCPLRI